MIDWTEIPNGDSWELFARDFLAELGFVIDIGPGRGADAGRDLVVSEQLRGRLRTKKFTWLVSCKNFAVSDKSVGPDQENNITDRLKQHDADGFIGFYSTVPSSGLVERLQRLEKSGDIAAFEIFDRKKIEGHFIDTGMSKLALRYFPTSYARMRPIQKFFGKYEDILCDVCGTDALAKSVRTPYYSNLVLASPINNHRRYESLHVVCKGDCDQKLQALLYKKGFITQWEDIGDLVNPILFLKNMLTYMNILHDREKEFSAEAHQRMKNIYVSLAQRTLREVNKEDEKRLVDLGEVEGL